MKRSVSLLAAVLLLQSPFSHATAPSIRGDTSTVTITSSDSAAHESGPDHASFTVTRSGGDISGSLTVGFSLTGSAVLGTDYDLTPAFVTAVNIAANQDSVTVVLTPRADNLVEGTEHAIVSLTAGSGYQLGGSTSVDIEISDDPVEVNLFSVDTNASELGPDPGTFTVVRTGGDITSTLTVGMSLSGSASLGSDYTLSPAFVTAVAISGGQSSVTVTLEPRPDNAVEGTEEAIVTLTPSANVYNLGSAITETISIADDPVEVSIVSEDLFASELSLDPATFTVSRIGGNTASTLTVGISIGGTATLGSDYFLTPAFVTAVAIPANEPSMTITATPRVLPGDLPGDEGEETIIVDLTMGNYLINSMASTTTLIIDDTDALLSDGFESPVAFASCIKALAKTAPERFVDQGATVFDPVLNLHWSSCGLRAEYDSSSGRCRALRALSQQWQGAAFGVSESHGGHAPWRKASVAERLAAGGACEGSLVR
ncbi:MAG: hypothetical protein KDI37_06045 [Xanthomonadales bacterium]|nr:hypothetical protein [Xanthomonadales bacterium]MCB1641275.1 hypothetical protein [Xanthomonadales bacterium]